MLTIKRITLTFAWLLPILLMASSCVAQDQVGIQLFQKNHTHPNSNEGPQRRIDARTAKPGTLTFETPANGSASPVAFRVLGPVRGFALQDQHKPPVGDLKAWIKYLTKDAKSDREKAEALFRFVIEEIKDWYYPAQGINLTVEDLGVLIWNFGFGYCYDMGRLQAGLWAEAGLRSRIVGWPQHTVAEVYYDGAWHLYDLQHRTFYEKSDGSVASFAELKENPKLFFQKLDRFGLDPIGYPPHHLAHWYQIASPKFEDSAEGTYWRFTKSFAFDLREGEFFEILYNDPGKPYHPDSWFQYYGEMTLRKGPPWLVRGRLSYVPGYSNKPAKWEKLRSPNGNPAFSLSMANPFIFTEAWIKTPKLQGFFKIWVKVFGETHFVGRLVGGNAILNRFIAGSNEFTIIVEPDGQGEQASDFGLEKAQVHTTLQLSPVGLPTLVPGKNAWPVKFKSGHPTFSLWYLEHAPDLRIESVKPSKEHPRPDEPITFTVTIRNEGSAPSQPTQIHLFNNTTAFLSETVEEVGVQTAPPINPGSSTKINYHWHANTRMTWYGQNPAVQLFDLWIDMIGDRADANRRNNRHQFHLHLAEPDGSMAPLPGYQPLKPHH